MSIPKNDRDLGQGTIVPFPISPEYVKGWTSPRAIVELIANALDEDSNATVRWADGLLTIEDNGPGIAQDAFLLGASKKTANQIGQFGEGKKLAALVLARDPDVGDVWFETVGYAFTPTIENRSLLDGIVPTRDGQASATLVYTLYPLDRTAGTKITIQCAQELADEAIARVLYLTEPGYTPPARKARILFGGVPGRIYIGGILVTHDPRLSTSYDLPLALAKGDQNRDRTFIDGRALEWHLKEALASCAEPDVIEHFVNRALTKEPIAAQEQYFTSVRDYDVRLAFRRIAGQILPVGKRLYYQGKGEGVEGIETDAWLMDSGVHLVETDLPRGQHEELMKLLGVERRHTAAHREVNRQERTTTWINHKDLTEAQRQNLDDTATLLRSILGEDSVGRTRAYTESRLVGYGTLGIYDRRADTIGFHLATLNSREQTISTAIRMAAHRKAYLQKTEHTEGAAGFTEALTEIATTFLGAYLALADDATASSHPTADGTRRKDAAPADTLSASHKTPTQHTKPNRDEIARARQLRDAPPLRRRLAELLHRRMKEVQTATGTRSVVRILRTVALSKVYWEVLDSPRPVGWRRSQGVSCVTDYDKITAIADLVGVNPAVIFLAHMAEEAPTYNRRGRDDSQKPWSGRLQESVTRAISDLQAAGGIYAEQIPSIEAMANGQTPCDNDGQWLKPLHTLLKAEEERLG
ncbi:hypothetical protein ACIQOV_29400 [Kitasatospora sp. NPDC091257]|uniref:hypothetical protein n=1 Tax=Kitasatospora sp. NPDC091257 TaxID=3364084 RepID=UPI0037FD0191